MLILFVTNRTGPMSEEALDHEIERGAALAIILRRMVTDRV